MMPFHCLAGDAVDDLPDADLMGVGNEERKISRVQYRLDRLFWYSFALIQKYACSSGHLQSMTFS
jgi:hypothetical protein